MVGEIEKKGERRNMYTERDNTYELGGEGNGRRRVKTEDEKNSICSYVFKFKEHYT